MKINKETKHDVKPGGHIIFSNGDTYTVTTVIKYQRGGVAYTIRDIKDGRTIFGIPASDCYGATFQDD